MDVSVEEIEAMKRIVDTCVGIERFTYQMQKNAPRPTGDYAAIKCTASVNPGFDETRIVEVGGIDHIRVRGIRILTFSIMFSREGDEFIKFDNSFYRPDVLQKLRDENFAAMGKSTLDLASLTLETNWEARQAVTMQFNVLRENVSPIGVMSGATAHGTFYDGNTAIEI